ATVLHPRVTIAGVVTSAWPGRRGSVRDARTGDRPPSDLALPLHEAPAGRGCWTSDGPTGSGGGARMRRGPGRLARRSYGARDDPGVVSGAVLATRPPDRLPLHRAQNVRCARVALRFRSREGAAHAALHEHSRGAGRRLDDADGSARPECDHGVDGAGPC